MGNVTQLKRKMFSDVDKILQALGNSNRSSKDLACDLINERPHLSDKDLADLTNLCPQTIQRVRENADEYTPYSDTVDRIIKACDTGLNSFSVKIKPQYRNKPKE